MKSKYLIIILLLFISINSFAQHPEVKGDTIFNTIDKNGLKQGFWKKHYSNGTIKYYGFFKDNKPIGKFNRYDIYGNIEAELYYPADTNKTYISYFHKNGNIKTKGIFTNQKKDSIWNFYTNDGHLINKVNYKNDEKNGIETKFYKNGKILEKTIWNNGEKNGPLLTYYKNGNNRSKIFFRNGIYDGDYIIFFEQGKIKIKGTFENNMKHGMWTYYNLDGTIKQEIEYINGKATNQKELDSLENIELIRLEKNKGKIQDPRDAMYNQIPPK